MLPNLTKLQTCILLALTKFRFLTNSQFHLLELGNIHTIRRTTKTLFEMSLIEVRRFPVSARAGRMEHVHSLTRKGWSIAADMVRYPLPQRYSAPVYELDFWHRKAVINFHILLSKSLTRHNRWGLIIDRYDQYFDKNGANNRKATGEPLHATTRIAFLETGFFIPDSIFILKAAHASWQALFTLEYVRGNKTERTIRQIKRHMKAIRQGVMRRRYRLPKGQDYISLFLFEREALLACVFRELSRNPKIGFAPYRHHFLFSTMTGAQKDVQRCWLKALDSRVYNFIDGSKAFKSST